MNVTNPIWRNCNASPERVAILFDGRPLSYGALQAGAEQASARLRMAGIVQGDNVALRIPNKMQYLLVLLAVARLGAVATPLPLMFSKDAWEELIVGNRVHSVVLDDTHAWQSENLPASRHLEVNQLLGPPVSGESLEAPSVIQGLDGEPWLIALSSGTTGKPKKSPQTHTHTNLLASLSPWNHHEDLERVFVFAALQIEYAMTSVIRQLYGGRTVVLTQSRTPEGFFATVRRDRPTKVITTTGSVSLFVNYAAKELPDSLKLCESINSIMVAGAFVPPALREGIVSRICPRLEVDYGSTETGSLALSTLETHAVRPNSTGRLNPWVEAQAVDENDVPLPFGQQGILRFKSPTVIGGYLDDEEATARAFRNGWFYPGDTGSVGAAGYLFLRGRVDDVINLYGNKIDSRLIEELLDGQPEINESVAIAVGRGARSPALIVVVEASAPFDSEALKRLCLERLGRMYVPDAIVQIDRLPRNESGKVRRRALAASIKFSDEKTAPEE